MGGTEQGQLPHICVLAAGLLFCVLQEEVYEAVKAQQQRGDAILRHPLRAAKPDGKSPTQSSKDGAAAAEEGIARLAFIAEAFSWASAKQQVPPVVQQYHTTVMVTVGGPCNIYVGILHAHVTTVW
jgi:hypothetical protein